MTASDNPKWWDSFKTEELFSYLKPNRVSVTAHEIFRKA